MILPLYTLMMDLSCQVCQRWSCPTWDYSFAQQPRITHCLCPKSMRMVCYLSLSHLCACGLRVLCVRLTHTRRARACFACACAGVILWCYRYSTLILAGENTRTCVCVAYSCACRWCVRVHTCNTHTRILCSLPLYMFIHVPKFRSRVWNLVSG